MMILRRRHPASARTDPTGFSLIELLVSMSILSVGLLAVIAMLPMGQQNVQLGGQTSKAAALAQEVVEAIKNDPFNRITLYNGLDGNGVDTRTPANFPADDTVNSPKFLGSTNLVKWNDDIQLFLAGGRGITGGYGTLAVDKPAQPAAGLHLVTVTVGWRDSGRDYRLVLRTLIAQ